MTEAEQAWLGLIEEGIFRPVATTPRIVTEVGPIHGTRVDADRIRGHWDGFHLVAHDGAMWLKPEGAWLCVRRDERAARLRTREDRIMEMVQELTEGDTDVLEAEPYLSTPDTLRAYMRIGKLSTLIHAYYGIGTEESRILEHLLTDYERWLGSRFERQVWHYTLRQDKDDDAIYLPDQPIHHYDRWDARCPVCRGKQGTDLVHVYDNHGVLVARGDEFGGDESLTGQDATQVELVEIGEIVAQAFK